MKETSKGHTLGTLMKQQKSRIVAEATPLIGAAEKCRELWKALRAADFRKEGVLNEINVAIVFEQKKHIIEDLLKISQPSDFLEVFDSDKDNFINEDEQILVFSIIKEKIKIIADALNGIHEYTFAKDLMKEVRAIEQDIVEFQKQLREYLYQKEKEEYAKIGEGKLKEFHNKWEKAFQDFDTESFNKLEQLKELHREQIEMLNQKLDRAIMAVKVKPTIKLRELQFQEKLVSANERVDEAINYRKELKNFEVAEAERVQKTKEKNSEKERQKLLNMQKKERDELEDKLERKKDKMKIQMQKEFDVLRKQVGMHKDEIEHIQNYLNGLYEKKGKVYDELKRFKEMERKTNTFVHAYKEVKEGKMESPLKTTVISGTNPLVFSLKKTLSLTTSLDSSLANNPAYRNIILPLKQLIGIGDYAKFDLSKDEYKYGKPVNVEQEDSTSTDLKKRVKKLLTQSKPKEESLPSLTKHYDDNLECHSDED